jgi:broad specificity phosphatase PhoE
MTHPFRIPVSLVRHASTAWTGKRYGGRSDPPLDDAGRLTADLLASELGPLLAPGTRIVSSPLIRALATAEAIAATAGIGPVLVDPRWRESDCGIAEGLTFDEVALRDPELAAKLASGAVDIDWPGGETAASLQERVREAWADLLADPRPALVVSHAGPLRLALALGMGRSPETVAFPAAGEAIHLSVLRPPAGPDGPGSDASRATLRR